MNVVLENQTFGKRGKKQKGYKRRHRFGIGGPQGVRLKALLEKRRSGRHSS